MEDRQQGDHADFDFDFLPPPPAYRKIGPVVSLDDMALLPDDWIDLVYDFGKSHNIVVKVLSVEEDQDVLPEHSFEGHKTRACIVSASRNKPPKQYGTCMW